ncbi:MAG: hypothetical protein CR986_02285 [Ignavibacteriae bacterium]|nr:MAG: hypothetical protein CR986_02285 [Ignavibacteriota bacterium]
MKFNTGIKIIDSKWGGVYSGGNYFILGTEKSGKTILNLNLIDHFLKNDKKVLFFSSERTKNLEIFLESINLSLKELILNKNFKFEKINNQISLINFIKNILDEFQPDVFLIDEIGDKNLNFIFNDYLSFLEHLENMNITFFFTSSIPKEQNFRLNLKKIVKTTTAIINLQKGKNNAGKIRLIPNIGHLEGEMEDNYKISPQKGFVTLGETVPNEDENKYENNHSNLFEYSNFYNFDEFKALFESKAAMCNKTDRKAGIISYEIFDEEIDIMELCEIFRENLEICDKITFKNNEIHILPGCEEKEKINELTEKLSNKLKELFKLSDEPEDYFEQKVIFLENKEDIKI